MASYPTSTSASGIWNIGDLSLYIQDGAWPPTPPPFPAARAIFGGGYLPYPEPATNVIDYVNFSSTGNATDFGDLTVARQTSAGLSSKTRMISGAGDNGGPAYTQLNVLDYVTIASTGNATDFGDDFTVGSGTQGSASNDTRGIFAGGYFPLRNTNTIRYVTIATLGNTSDFGDLTVGRYQIQTAINSSTRGVWAGGNT